MSSYIMAIDQGTTSTRTCLFDQAGSLVTQVAEAYRQIYPKPGWVEHDPEDIWRTTVNTMKGALEKAGIAGSQIKCIGITNQRETVILWDKQTHKPVYNAIVWQCRRTQDICEKLRSSKKDKMIFNKTGLVLDPYFSATKIQWILQNSKEAKNLMNTGNLRAGNIDTFILSRLSRGSSHKTDVSNASRTMLMSLQSLKWDQDLLKLFGIKENILPEISTSSGHFGATRGLGFMPDGIPITGMAGDQQAALFGQAGFSLGEVKCTFGTGSFILLNTGNKIVRSKSRLLSTVAWQLEKEKPVYALEGGAFVCGAAVQWLRDGLGLISSSSEIESLAASVVDTNGVEFVPALTGLGAPYWRAEARGVITGLTRGATKAHIARATLEAMALQNADILQVMQKDLGRKLKSIKVDGGAAINNLLMQLQADFSGVQVVRPKNTETTALGAAYLAGLGAGIWTSLGDIQKIWQTDHDFKVHMSQKLRNNRVKQWQDAVRKA
jgi:glycerol kinase